MPLSREEAVFATAVRRAKPIVRSSADVALPSIRETFGLGPISGVVFHHIPKCAGTSIQGALKRAFAPWQYKEVDATSSAFAVTYLDHGGQAALSEFNHAQWVRIHEFRQRLLLTYLQGGAKAVSGHVVYHPLIHDQFVKTHKFVTILRHPVARFASQYLQHAKSWQRYHMDVSWDDEGLAEVGPIWGRTIATFLGGSPDISGQPQTVERMVQNAKASLDRLDIVGFVEDIAGFQEDLEQAIGGRIRIGRRNWSSSAEKSSTSLDHMKPQIEQYCAPDIEIYNYARSLHANRPRKLAL